MMSDFDKSLKNKKHVGGGRAQQAVGGVEAHLFPTARIVCLGDFSFFEEGKSLMRRSLTQPSSQTYRFPSRSKASLEKGKINKSSQANKVKEEEGNAFTSFLHFHTRRMEDTTVLLFGALISLFVVDVVDTSFISL